MKNLLREAFKSANNRAFYSIEKSIKALLAEGVGDLIERIAPDYITFEFNQKSKEGYRQFIIDQGKLLGYV